MTAGCAYPLDPVKVMEVRGRDLISGIPKTIEVTSEEIREAISEPVSLIVDAVKDALENSPPELAGDIVDRGIMLTGGGALLQGLDRFAQGRDQATGHGGRGSPFCRRPGAGMALDQIDVLKEVALKI